KNMKWLNYDLHTHSEYSKIHKKGDKDKVKSMDAYDFIAELKKNYVDVFSITDHNIFSSDYYEQVKNELQKDEFSNMRIIPGVELDTYVDLKDDEEDDFFQMACYFHSHDYNKIDQTIQKLYNDNNKPKLSEIITTLNSTEIKYILVPEGNKERGIGKSNFFRKISKESINKLDAFAMYKIFGGFDTNNFDEGNQNYWAKRFYQETKEFENFIQKMNPEEINDLVTKIDDIFKKNLDITNYDDEVKQVYEIVKKYAKYFAYFDFSDWHNKEPYKHDIKNYIFTEPNYVFEALELAMIDPESRLIVTTETEINLNNAFIRKLSFKIDGVKKVVDFTPGLNAIIGKRGSGKSLLHAAINELYDKGCNNLRKYSDLNITEIHAKLHNDNEIKPGQLSSVSILNQDEIKSIFENPSNFPDFIIERFPEGSKVNLDKVKILNDLLDNISTDNFQYKNITPVIQNISFQKDFVFSSSKKLIDSKHLIEIYENINDQFTSYIKAIKSTKLSSDKIESIYNDFMGEHKTIVMKIKLYNEIIGSMNDSIEVQNQNRQKNQKLSADSRKNINDYLKTIFDKLQLRLFKKKILSLYENLSVTYPNVKATKSNGYVFIVKPNYLIGKNIKEEVFDKLNEVLKGISKMNFAEAIEEYIKGNVVKRSGKENSKINDALNKYIVGIEQASSYDNYQYEIYSENKKVETDSIITQEVINDYLDKGFLGKISASSLGVKTVAYLDMLFSKNETILLFDQPEDNIDNEYIGEHLIHLIKEKKKDKQIIFVTHNPSIAVYGDAFNYIFATNDDEIKYENLRIYSQEQKNKVLKILEGGKPSFANRNKKYGEVLGGFEYGNKY
ncbi:MAG: AAA family ATPase, partial [Candidatus Woesearchaeota archaeon]